MKIVLNGKSEETKNLGLSRNAREGSNKTYLKNIVWKNVNCMNLAQNVDCMSLAHNVDCMNLPQNVDCVSLAQNVDCMNLAQNAFL